jgi:DNA-binding NtrC family response regulator
LQYLCFQSHANNPFKNPLVSVFCLDRLERMILIVEDDDATRYSFARLMRTAGHEVMEARNGEEGLALLAKHDFDLVITDLAMPKVTGFGLLTEMRLKWPEIPVILVTAYLSPEAAKAVLQEKVIFLPKPLDPGKLMASVERFTLSPR